MMQVVRCNPQVTALGYFNVSKRLIPQVSWSADPFKLQVFEPTLCNWFSHLLNSVYRLLIKVFHLFVITPETGYGDDVDVFFYSLSI